MKFCSPILIRATVIMFVIIGQMSDVWCYVPPNTWNLHRGEYESFTRWLKLIGTSDCRCQYTKYHYILFVKTITPSCQQKGKLWRITILREIFCGFISHNDVYHTHRNKLDTVEYDSFSTPKTCGPLGEWFNINLSSYQSRIPHYIDAMVVTSAYVYNGTFGKTSLCWITLAFFTDYIMWNFIYLRNYSAYRGFFILIEYSENISQHEYLQVYLCLYS